MSTLVMNPYNEDELYHYGKLGMKWGVRRASRYNTGSRVLDRALAKRDKRAGKIGKANDKLTKAREKFDKQTLKYNKAKSKYGVRWNEINYAKMNEASAKYTKANVKFDKANVRVNKAVKKANKSQAKAEKLYDQLLAKGLISKKQAKDLKKGTKYGRGLASAYHGDVTGAELYHFGIRGMKWGVRRALGQGGLIKKNGQKTIDPSKLAKGGSSTVDVKGIGFKAGVKLAKDSFNRDMQRIRTEKEAKRIEKANKAEQRLQAAKAKALEGRTAPANKAQQQATNQSYHQDHVRFEKLKRMNVKDMSNDDISFLTKRVALEKQYNQIQSEAYAKAHPYKTAAKKIAKDLVKEAGKAATNKARDMALSKANDIAKELGLGDLGLGGKKSGGNQQKQSNPGQQSNSNKTSGQSSGQKKQNTNKRQTNNSNTDFESIFKDYDFTTKKWNNRTRRLT